MPVAEAAAASFTLTARELDILSDRLTGQIVGQEWQPNLVKTLAVLTLPSHLCYLLSYHRSFA